MNRYDAEEDSTLQETTQQDSTAQTVNQFKRMMYS